MSFWNLSDNTSATATVNNGFFESSGGDLEPIPAGTQLQSIIEEAKWAEYEGNKYISLKWKVLDGEFKNRVIYQKVHVYGNPTAKDKAANADNAKRMLAAIDANSGGQLMQVAGEPSDMDLARCISNKMMTIQVQVWEMEVKGETKSGNWINAVAPRGQVKAAPAANPATTAANGQIPF